MTETKWTPGPWQIANYGDIFSPHGGESGDGVYCDENDAWQIAEVGFYYASVDGLLTEVSRGVSRANARLIVKAPEMYDKLEEALETLEDVAKYSGLGYSEAGSLCDEIKSLLAEARGEE